MKVISLTFAFVASAAALTINTPASALIECQNTLLTWDGAYGPTQIAVFPPGVTTGEPLETLPVVEDGTQFTWLVDLPVGSYTLVIKDLATGESAASGLVQITPNPSGDTSCEGKNGSGNPGSPSGVLTMNTPTGALFECENTLLTWDGSVGPVKISVFPVGDVDGHPIETLPVVQSGHSVVFLVDLPPAEYTLGLKDLTTGQTVFSGAVTVEPNPSGDTSCQISGGAPALPTINTPVAQVNECEDVLITWTGAVHGSQIFVFPAGATAGPPIERFPIQLGQSFLWHVDVPPASYQLGLKDLSTGKMVFTAAFTVSPNPEGDSSCEGKNRFK